MYNVVTRKVSDGVLRHFKCMRYYSLLGNDLNCDRGYIWSHTSVSTLILHTHVILMIYVYMYSKSLECSNYETLVCIMRHWYVL